MSLVDSRWTGWVYPLPTLDGNRDAVITDGFSAEKTPTHRQHLGVDVMYRRQPNEPAELPRGTKLFYVPANTPVLAAFGGKIWNTSVTDYGHSVTIDHGDVPGIGPAVTFYQHMSSFAQPWKKGDVVRAGDVLGIVGGSLVEYTLHHLHFELWLPTRDKVVDPEPYMARWERLSVHGRRGTKAPSERGATSMPLVIGVGAGLLALGLIIATASSDELA
jgi:murein DD-endopeptidase MepM/ murein hydrolase activator NlpD